MCLHTVHSCHAIPGNSASAGGGSLVHSAERCLGAQDIVIVEGLVLDEVTAGVVQLTCLPLKLEGSDGAPARCVVQL